jgi:hypothetical protein
MKEYQTTKRVKAAKIIATRNNTHGSGDVNAVILDDGELFHVREGWWKAKEAAIGGYLVIYQDGYASYSPAEPFEKSATVIREPATSLEQAQAIVETKTAPRITKDTITNAIESVVYAVHFNTLTLCLLKMKNGFIVVGKAAPADARNFDAEVGKRFAYEDAFKQLWPLMGFALCDYLTEQKAIRELSNKDRLARVLSEPATVAAANEATRGRAFEDEAHTVDQTSGSDEPDQAA